MAEIIDNKIKKLEIFKGNNYYCNYYTFNNLILFSAHLQDYQNRLPEEEAASQLLKNARK